MQIYFITGNKGKVLTAKKHLQKFGIEVLNQDLDIQEPYVNDIKYISRYKAKEGFKIIQKPCIALDAGFYIPHFPGVPNFPGAFPKRDLLDAMGVQGLLDKMKNVKKRDCYFMECLSYYDGKKFKQFTRKVIGSLTEEKKGQDKEQKWSELWSVFIPKNFNKTLAEMTDEEYMQFSNKTVNAFDDFGKWLIKQEKK